MPRLHLPSSSSSASQVAANFGVSRFSIYIKLSLLPSRCHPPRRQTKLRRPRRETCHGKPSSKQSIMLQEYLRSGPTITERYSGVLKPSRADKPKKRYVDEAKAAIEKFDDVWARKG
ncbi:hypothetical protein M426DRAFT_27931 [Hypoxylon sp. CI-4A]|nr:hypothetical protein M426DRAFT_27931 [Hypoxylon sp. CI-4A]